MKALFKSVLTTSAVLATALAAEAGPRMTCTDGSCPATRCANGVCATGACADGVCDANGCANGVCDSNACVGGKCGVGGCPTGFCGTTACPDGKCDATGVCGPNGCPAGGPHAGHVLHRPSYGPTSRYGAAGPNVRTAGPPAFGNGPATFGNRSAFGNTARPFTARPTPRPTGTKYGVAPAYPLAGRPQPVGARW